MTTTYEREAPTVTEAGVYENENGVYVVKPNRQGTRLYAKRLVEINAERATESGERVTVEFVYEPGAIFRLEPGDKMEYERAKELTIRYGRCIVCGRRLKAAQSVEEGIGPVCRKSFAQYVPKQMEIQVKQEQPEFECTEDEERAYSGYVGYGLSMSDGYYGPMDKESWIKGLRSNPEANLRNGNDCSQEVKDRLLLYYGVYTEDEAQVPKSLVELAASIEAPKAAKPYWETVEYRTHNFQGDEGDERCYDCDCRPSSEYARQVCGAGYPGTLQIDLDAKRAEVLILEAFHKAEMGAENYAFVSGVIERLLKGYER